MSALSISQSTQVVVVAVCTVLLAFCLRSLLKVEVREKVFREKFTVQKAERDTIGIIPDLKSRDALYTSADQSIDEDFNTYLAQHYFRYVLIYLLPLFLVMAWLNSSLDEHVLPVVSGQAYLFLLPSKTTWYGGRLCNYALFVELCCFVDSWVPSEKKTFQKRAMRSSP